MAARKRKAVVGLAGLALAGGACLGGIVAAPVAGAASQACGSSCVSLYNQKFGSADVSAVSGGTAAAGQAVILAAATSSTAEDWTSAPQGAVSDFYAAGLMNATLDKYYGSDQVYEFQYAPAGIDSGECLGIASGPKQGTMVTLQPCTAMNSTWIYDTAAASGGYVPYISGLDTKYPAPYVLTAAQAGGDFSTQSLQVNSQGVVAKDQMWQLFSGVLGSPACSISWVNTSGGDWMTPANWSLDRVPTSTDDVCINAPGTYIVELTNSAGGIVAPTVNSLTVGGAKASGSQTLDVYGQNPDNVVAGYGASLGATTTTSINASGIVQLRAQDYGAAVSLGANNTINSGEIITQPRDGYYTLIGSILNQGIISIGGPTQLSASGISQKVTNEKQIEVTSGGQITSFRNGSPTFVNDTTGTLSIASGGSMTYGMEFVASGRIIGTAPVVDSVVFTGTGSGPVILSQITSGVLPTFSGSLAPGQKLTINAAQAEWNSNSGTNAGTITLSSASAAGSELQLAGTLANTGTISLAPGAGGPRHISNVASSCAIDNSGTLSLGTLGLTLDCDLTQETAGTVAMTVSSVPSKGRFGTITSSASATLGGNLTVKTTLSTLQPGATYPIMSFKTLTYPDTFNTYTYVGPTFHSANYDFNVGTVTLVAP